MSPGSPLLLFLFAPARSPGKECESFFLPALFSPALFSPAFFALIARSCRLFLVEGLRFFSAPFGEFPLVALSGVPVVPVAPGTVPCVPIAPSKTPGTDPGAPGATGPPPGAPVVAPGTPAIPGTPPDVPGDELPECVPEPPPPWPWEGGAGGCTLETLVTTNPLFSLPATCTS